jgi:hypothetical protein
MEIIPLIDDRFNHVKYFGEMLTYLQKLELDFLKKYPNLKTITLSLDISELGDFRTIQSASTHQIDNLGEILDIRVDFIGYRYNEKPDTQEFYKKVKAEIDNSLL